MPSPAKPSLQALYLRLPNWVGDVCMSLPSLAALLRGPLPVIVCARPWAQDLLQAYGLGGFVPLTGQWRSDRRAVHAWRKRARHGRTAGLLLPDSLSSAMVFRFAGIPCAGYRDDGRSPILRWPIAKPAGRLHAVESWYHLTQQALQRWGMGAIPARPPESLDWQAAPGHRARANAALQAAGIAHDPFVLIAPTATGLHKGRVKVWPGFDALARTLQARGYRVLMAPTAAERADALAAAPTAECLDPLPLGAYAALTARASLAVCNDSGASHLCAASGARQITLFGVTDPARTGPWSPRACKLGGMGAWPSASLVSANALSLLETGEPA